jgi:hypothetical protein
MLSGIEIDEADSARLHQSEEDECRQMLRAQWLPGCSAGCWGQVTSLPE